MKPILSVLICTVYGREAQLARALGALIENIKIESETVTADKSEIVLIVDQAHRIEIIIRKDNKELPVGAKRQQLLHDASGEWIVFFDDDDLPYKGYLRKILTAVLSRPDADCCGINGDMTINKSNPQTWIHSIKYKRWASNVDGFSYVRPPIHFNPVKRVLALRAGFKPMRYAEDHDYSMRLLPLLRKEVVIKDKLFLYDYSNKVNNREKFRMQRNTLTPL